MWEKNKCQFVPHTGINSKWINYLNKNIKIENRKYEKTPLASWHGKENLIMIQSTEGIKAEVNNLTTQSSQFLPNKITP